MYCRSFVGIKKGLDVVFQSQSVCFTFKVFLNYISGLQKMVRK